MANENNNSLLNQLVGQVQINNDIISKIKQEEGEKALRGFFKKSADEIAAQPGGFQVIASSMSPQQVAGKEAKAGNTKEQAGTEGQAQTQSRIPKERSILGGLIRQTPGERGKELQNALLEQQISGQQPLQKRERETFSIKQGFELEKQAHKASLDSLKETEKNSVLTANQVFGKFEPVANNFQGIVDSFARVQASVEDPSPAGDLALIFNFMKILDPNSVVRESEFANAQNSAGVPERIRGLYNRVVSGKRISAKQRNDFSSRAKRLFDSKERQFRNTEKEFKRISERNSIDPTNVLRRVELVPAENTIQSIDDELKQIDAQLGAL